MSVGALHRALAGLVLAGLALAVASCSTDPSEGWSTRSIFDSNVRTIAIPVFENDTFERGVEVELTEALVKEIRRRTPWQVTTEGEADSILSGRVRSVELELLSRSRQTRLAEEVLVQVAVDFEWRDQRSGRLLVGRERFEASSLFVPSMPTGEPLEAGRFAAVERLAGDIVDELQASW